MRRIRTPLAMAAVALALAAPASLAWANMAAPPPERTVHAGSPLGEPAGGLQDVFIEHETLRIDLRPLADAKPVWIEAAYRVRNDGPARSIDLLFVANGLARGRSTVTVDGKPVPATPGAAGPLPPRWRPPATTPGLAPADAPRRDPLPYRPTSEGTLSFRAPLPSGSHEIRVRYPAEATAYSVNELTPVWQLGYVLAPAREWAGFGGADVRVDLPHGWAARANDPSLRRAGDVLSATWRQVPVDALAISVQKPEPGSGKWYLLVFVLSLGVLAGLAWLARGLGRRLGARGRTSAWALPVTALLAIGWTVASAFAYGAVPDVVRREAGAYVGDYAIRAMSYGTNVLLVVVCLVMLPAGWAVLQVAAWLGRRSLPRSTPSSPAPPPAVEATR
jgi:hypothetical protein